MLAETAHRDLVGTSWRSCEGPGTAVNRTSRWGFLPSQRRGCPLGSSSDNTIMVAATHTYGCRGADGAANRESVPPPMATPHDKSHAKRLGGAPPRTSQTKAQYGGQSRCAELDQRLRRVAVAVGVAAAIGAVDRTGCLSIPNLS